MVKWQLWLAVPLWPGCTPRPQLVCSASDSQQKSSSFLDYIPCLVLSHPALTYTVMTPPYFFFFLHQISPTPLHFALVIEIQDETFLKCDNTASSIVSIFFPPAKYYLSLHFSFQDFTSLASSQKTSHQVPWKGCFRCPYLCVCSGATAASVREGQDCPCHTQLVPHRAHRRAQLSPALTLLLPLEIPIRKGQNAKLQWGTKHEEKPYNVKLRRSTGK